MSDTMKKELPDVSLSDFYVSESKGGRKYPKVSILGRGWKRQVEVSPELDISKVPMDVPGVASVEYELKLAASFREYGRVTESPGYFPVRLIGFQPFGAKDRSKF